MKISVTEAQKIFLRIYDDGHYAHMADLTGEILDHHLEQISDPLALCMMILLDSSTGCVHLEEAYGRLRFVAEQTQDTLMAVLTTLHQPQRYPSLSTLV